MKSGFEWMTRAIGQRLRTLYSAKQRPLNWTMIDKVETLLETEMAEKAKAFDAARDQPAKQPPQPVSRGRL